MSPPKITFYVDIVSPFGYIAFYLLQNSPVFKSCEITYIPIVLGGLMKACGNTPPLTIKNKSKWINTERTRMAKYFKVPMMENTPPGFPSNTLPIQRALVSLSQSHPQSLPSAIALFWQNFWVHWNDPAKPENIHTILRTVVGSDEEATKIIERTKTDEVKKGLMGNTDMAFKDGAFGLPWFSATNSKGETEKFWGVDHIGQLCDHLDLENPAGKGWRAML